MKFKEEVGIEKRGMRTISVEFITETVEKPTKVRKKIIKMGRDRRRNRGEVMSLKLKK